MESSTDYQNTPTDPESQSSSAGEETPAETAAEPETKVEDPTGGAAGDLPEIIAEAEEKGYLGVATDETPNEAYTLQGVAKGQPTPETERQPSDAVEADADASESNADASG
jgi:hypothetical protein